MANLSIGAKSAKSKNTGMSAQLSALSELKERSDMEAVHDLIGQYYRDLQQKQESESTKGSKGEKNGQ